MSKTNKELYEDISKIFVENGICSTDFAKLTELYRRTEMEGMVTEKRVIDEVKSMLKDNRCKCGYNGSLWDAFYELKQKYEVK